MGYKNNRVGYQKLLTSRAVIKRQLRHYSP